MCVDGGSAHTELLGFLTAQLAGGGSQPEAPSSWPAHTVARTLPSGVETFGMFSAQCMENAGCASFLAAGRFSQI